VGYGINSGCVYDGAYLVAHAREFATMKYHTGRRKSDDKVIRIQRVRDAFRKDKPTDAPFEFPLKSYHDEAFHTLDGWLDSWWHYDPSVSQIVVPDDTAEVLSAADELQHARMAGRDDEAYLPPDRSHQDWLAPPGDVRNAKGKRNKDNAIHPAIVIPSGNGLVTVAPERIELECTDRPTDDAEGPDSALSDTEWEAVESMGNLLEFAYGKWTNVLIRGQMPDGPPMELVAAISNGEILTVNLR
jgi:hypothetical protein